MESEPIQAELQVVESQIEQLEKPKKPRTEAQLAATAKMLATKKAKREAESEAIKAQCKLDAPEPVVESNTRNQKVQDEMTAEHNEAPLGLAKPKIKRAPKAPKESVTPASSPLAPQFAFVKRRVGRTFSLAV